MKIELSDDAIEDIVCATLKEHMKYLKKNIKEHNKKSKLTPWEEQDLSHDLNMLHSMKEVYGYFGGNL